MAMKYLIGILGVKRKDRIQNITVGEDLKTEPITKTIEISQTSSDS